MLLVGIGIDWLLGSEPPAEVSLVLGTIGVIVGLIGGVWWIRRLEAVGYRFPKVVDDGAPWIVDRPPNQDHTLP
jgi:hypothetical protein